MLEFPPYSTDPPTQSCVLQRGDFSSRFQEIFIPCRSTIERFLLGPALGYVKFLQKSTNPPWHLGGDIDTGEYRVFGEERFEGVSGRKTVV